MNIEIEHSAKGSQRPNHKYVSRKLVNGKWQYYYKNSKVGSLQKEVDTIKRDIDYFTKKRKLNAKSAKGHISELRKSTGSYIKNPSILPKKPKASLAKAGYKAVVSDYYRDKLDKANRKLKVKENDLYKEARNDARKVMSDPRYKRQLAKNAAKALKQNPTYKAKRRVETAKTKALKRLALKNKIKYTINKGKRKVKKLVKAIKRK